MTRGDCGRIHIFCDEAPEVASAGFGGRVGRHPGDAVDTRRL